MYYMVNIDNEKCIGCGLCVSDCVADNIVIENGKATLINSCLQCGHCVSICPMNAVTIPDYDMNDVEDFDEKRFGFEEVTYLLLFGELSGLGSVGVELLQ